MINEFTGNAKIIYPNGIIYHGEIKKNKKDGFGILFFENGKIYYGYFKNDIKNGKGI